MHRVIDCVDANTIMQSGPAANTSQSTTMTQWSNTITQSSGEQSSNMTSSMERKRFCADGRFDAITSFQGITYAFKGKRTITGSMLKFGDIVSFHETKGNIYH